MGSGVHLARKPLIEAQHLAFQIRQIIAECHIHAADSQEIGQNAVTGDRGDGSGWNCTP